ncbi:MAG: CpsD/CapB family tyrosine-protein kinase, partial [Coprobacillus sp.]|nr:CpsD/CapB family tyrosine-protein kinase [Coprobacillus sp.]
TSTLPNEGKSTVAVNSAISLAQKGYKTALVDLDLRNPSVYHILKEDQICGDIGEYLKGDYCYEEILNSYQDYPLDIIYGVKAFDESTEMLSKERLGELIEQLKKDYEFVILDVPPLYLLEDAMIISRYCDSSFIVIKQDFASVYNILDALEELNSHLPQISGTIISQAQKSIFKEEERHYGYGYK